eukprot:jgi/Bigna1/137404/aug1.39_g12112
MIKDKEQQEEEKRGGKVKKADEDEQLHSRELFGFTTPKQEEVMHRRRNEIRSLNEKRSLISKGDLKMINKGIGGLALTADAATGGTGAVTTDGAKGVVAKNIAEQVVVDTVKPLVTLKSLVKSTAVQISVKHTVKELKNSGKRYSVMSAHDMEEDAGDDIKNGKDYNFLGGEDFGENDIKNGTTDYNLLDEKDFEQKQISPGIPGDGYTVFAEEDMKQGGFVVKEREVSEAEIQALLAKKKGQTVKSTARKAESDRVRFSISAPPLAVPGAKFSIDLWGYIRQMHAEVVESMKAKGQKEAGVSDKFYKIDRGSVITAVMSLPPKEFSLLGNRVQRVTWGGKKCQLEFPTKCNENAKLGSRPLCRCEIMFKLTVIEIEFRLEVGNEAMRVEELVTQQTKMPLKTPIIPGAAVQIKKRIGEGQFGEVFLAEYDKENVVVKYLKQPTSTSRRSSEQQLREFETEMALCHMLGHHPNVCAFRGAIREGSKMGIVTRFYENGSIEDYLHSSSQQKKSSPSKTDLLSDEQRLTIARDACSG